MTTLMEATETDAGAGGFETRIEGSVPADAGGFETRPYGDAEIGAELLDALPHAGGRALSAQVAALEDEIGSVLRTAEEARQARAAMEDRMRCAEHRCAAAERERDEAAALLREALAEGSNDFHGQAGEQKLSRLCLGDLATRTAQYWSASRGLAASKGATVLELHSQLREAQTDLRVAELQAKREALNAVSEASRSAWLTLAAWALGLAAFSGWATAVWLWFS